MAVFNTKNIQVLPSPHKCFFYEFVYISISNPLFFHYYIFFFPTGQSFNKIDPLLLQYFSNTLSLHFNFLIILFIYTRLFFKTSEPLLINLTSTDFLYHFNISKDVLSLYFIKKTKKQKHCKVAFQKFYDLW